MLVVRLAPFSDFGAPGAFAFGQWIGLIALTAVGSWLVLTGRRRMRRRRSAAGMVVLAWASVALLAGAIPDKTPEPSIVDFSLPVDLLGLRQEPSETAELQGQLSDGEHAVTAFYGTLDEGFAVLAFRHDSEDTRRAAHDYLSGMSQQGYVLSEFTSVDSGILGGHGECANASRAGRGQQLCVWASASAIMLFVDGHDATPMQSAERGLVARHSIVSIA